MRELLMAAAERGIRYLEGLNRRGVAPEPTVVARLAELDIPLPAHPSPAEETVALLDTYNTATMAMAGPRFFGFVIGGVLPAALATNWLSGAWDQNSALAEVTPLTAKLEDVALRWLCDVFGLPPDYRGAGSSSGRSGDFRLLARPCQLPRPNSQFPINAQRPSQKLGSWELGISWELGTVIWEFRGHLPVITK